jgi:metal-responsive CopG/Arc/MetJ family transcriptional regulator
MHVKPKAATSRSKRGCSVFVLRGNTNDIDEVFEQLLALCKMQHCPVLRANQAKEGIHGSQEGVR